MDLLQWVHRYPEAMLGLTGLPRWLQSATSMSTCIRDGVAGAAPALGGFPPVLPRQNLLLLEVAQHPPQQLRVDAQLLSQPRRLHASTQIQLGRLSVFWARLYLIGIGSCAFRF
jgi:hypothetical protein